MLRPSVPPMDHVPLCENGSSSESHAVISAAQSPPQAAGHCRFHLKHRKTDYLNTAVCGGKWPQEPSSRSGPAYHNLGCSATLWFSYPFAKGTAMNLVASAVLTCISTLGLPLASACTSAERTSPTVATALPPTLRMTSPVLRPCSAAGPLGSTDITTRPF